MNEENSCPECGKPNQFGELCFACIKAEMEIEMEVLVS